jgi:hypothetical protein
MWILDRIIKIAGGWVVLVVIWELSVLLWSKPFTFKLSFGTITYFFRALPRLMMKSVKLENLMAAK